MQKIVFFLLSIGFTVSSFAQDLDFVRIEEGTYTVGEDGAVLNPRRTVFIKEFNIATTELTNAAFLLFVEATGYRTTAERYCNAQVFEPGLEEFRWIQDSTACWRFPNGVSRGGIVNKMDHPVTCISYRDAIAYCKWAGVRLPTFEEWEVAAKAGSTGKYFEGASEEKIEEYANIWHKDDHLKPDFSDGYMYTAPVKSFKANPWGLYDVLGNVFEFCEGRIPQDKGRKVAHARGGSWWCNRTSCAAFNTVFIGSVAPMASFSNLGFRVVRD